MLQRITDGLVSLTTRLGTSVDKGASARYQLDLLDDQQLEASFRTSWLARKIVMIPAFDAVRKWREWTGDERANEVENLEDLLGVKAKVLEAKWKARLFGGAALLIGTEEEDLSLPLDPSTVGLGGLRYLTVLTRRDLVAGVVELDPRLARYGLPREYTISTNSGAVLQVHPSRLVELYGDKRPHHFATRSGQFGWGDSVLQSAYDAVRNVDSTMANIAALVFDARTSVVKIPGLSRNIVDPKFEEALLNRFYAFRQAVGNHGLALLDAEETLETRSYSFPGLSDVANTFMQVAAGAADIPATRFIGSSPGGLNATGESDLSNYYDRIQSIQTLELEPAMSSLDEVLVRSALGEWPEDLTYNWRPLKQMSEKDNSEIRSRNADTLAKTKAAGVYDLDEIAAMGAAMMRETGLDSLSNTAAGLDDDNEDAVLETMVPL